MKYMCVFAHPDDESFAVGGTLATLSKDNDVYLICSTDGDHQDLGLKNIRKAELKASAEILGIKKVFQLDFSDGNLCNANYHLLAAKIREILDTLQPDIIITFHANGLSGHLDHIAVTSVVDYLFDKLSYIQEVWYYSRLQEGKSLPQDYFVYRPDGFPKSKMDKIIDISTVWDTKVKSMMAHKSMAKDANRIIDRYKTEPKRECFQIRSKHD